MIWLIKCKVLSRSSLKNIVVDKSVIMAKEDSLVRSI
jgi:hypothetical protein